MSNPRKPAGRPDAPASSGDPDVTVEIVGPAGGGAAAVVADDAELVTLPAAAPSPGGPVIPVPAGGPGVGADRIAEPELATRSVAVDPRTADPRGPVAGDGFGIHDAVGRPAGASSVPGAAARTLVDPVGVPGTHILEALTRIQRDRRTYEPGEDIELDFRGYEELVAIGAVPPIDWRTGERIRIPPSPGAARY